MRKATSLTSHLLRVTNKALTTLYDPHNPVVHLRARCTWLADTLRDQMQACLLELLLHASIPNKKMSSDSHSADGALQADAPRDEMEAFSGLGFRDLTLSELLPRLAVLCLVSILSSLTNHTRLYHQNHVWCYSWHFTVQ